MHKRTFYLNPVINTSIRGHGKWGDFLVALIPLSWCGNILVNSNFILRMIEWQNESSLFTLRVQGKQWYWVYKFEASSVNSILAAPKNIGHNRWFVSTPDESYSADSYYQALSLGTQLESRAIYLNELGKANIDKNVLERQDKLSNYLANPFVISSDANDIFSNENSITNLTSNNIIDFNTGSWTNSDLYNYSLYNLPIIDNQTNFTASLLTSVKEKPLTILSGVLNKHNLEILKDSNASLNKPVLFTAKFWLNNGSLEPKTTVEYLDWGFKQKRYKRLDKFQYLPRVYYDKNFLVDNKTTISMPDASASPIILKSELLIDSAGAPSKESVAQYHNTVKYNRHRGELVPANLARRLLRTKRTLVLPAHVNITIITNSYDVVHSWFIPGLGLKLDCVPGRSTHHSFYIDNIGFYYGQCAEICGRYHHHMPIRLCALPFEQFLVWWQKRGVGRLHRIKALYAKKVVNPNNIKFRYRW